MTGHEIERTTRSECSSQLHWRASVPYIPTVLFFQFAALATHPLHFLHVFFLFKKISADVRVYYSLTSALFRFKYVTNQFLLIFEIDYINKFYPHILCNILFIHIVVHNCANYSTFYVE